MCLPSTKQSQGCSWDAGRMLAEEHRSVRWQWAGTEEVTCIAAGQKADASALHFLQPKGPFMAVTPAEEMRPAWKVSVWAAVNPSCISPILPPCLAGSSEEGSAYLFCYWEAGVRLWTLALSGSECPHSLPTFLAQRGSYLICYTLFSCCLGVEQGRD